MIWVGVGAALVLILLVAARLIRFDVARAPSEPSGGARVQRFSAQQEIVFKGPDGRERRYASLQQVPADLRAAVEEAQTRGTVRTRIVVFQDGEQREFDSIESAPPDLREKIAAAGEGPAASGIVIEVDGRKHYYKNPDEVPARLRKFLDPS